MSLDTWYRVWLILPEPSDHALYLASAMQQAFYDEGMSLSDPKTYHTIALANKIDPIAVLELLDINQQ